MKRIRTMKKVATIATAALMTACLAVPAALYVPNFADQAISVSAAETTYTLTIKSNVAGHTYEAYQIFAGDLSSDGKLSNITWGSGVSEAGKTALGDASAKSETLTEANAPAFAKEVSDYLATVAGTADAVSENVYSITGLKAGYYLIKDQNDTQDKENGAYTSYILKVVGNTEADLKTGIPTLVKKVQENTNISTSYTHPGLSTADTNYNDIADYNIGDMVPFKLYGTMPANIGDYTSYYYEFSDQLDSQFTITSSTAVTVKVDGVAVEADKNMRIVIDPAANTIKVSFEDIKAKVPTITKNSVVTVEYSALLNETAEIGRPGQLNAAQLIYSNNPNEDYAPNTGNETTDTPGDSGTTPWDKVIVFTYEMDVTKVDALNTNTKLKDAEFKLSNASGKFVIVDEDGIVTGWADSIEGGSVLKSGEDGLFVVIGLDDGEYSLQETKAPEGYNLLANALTVTVDATTPNTQEWNDFDDEKALTALTVKVDEGEAVDGNLDTGAVALEVQNKSGQTLPGTGGIGTTLFYLIGGIMVAGSGVYLISKKRMSNKEEK